MKCFLTYFAPLFLYLKNVLQLSWYDLVAVGSLMVSGGIAGFSYFLDLNYFGVSNLLILIVLGTIGGNTAFGVWKSRIQSKKALLKAKKLESGPEYRLQMKLYKRYKFDYKKLQFVFFKALTFLIYLKVAATFLSEGGGFLDWTAAVIIQTPIAIMWYVEWKSIGDNSEVIYGRKAPIFKITESIFEAQFVQHFKKNPKTPEV